MTGRGDAAVVGLIAPRYAPAIGGVERCVEMLARGLVQRGTTVEVITTDPTGSLPREEVRDGVLVRRFATVGQEVFFVAPNLGWWLLKNANRFDVLHAHSYHTPLALQAALASRWCGVPLVVTPYYHGTGHSLLRKTLHRPYRPFGSWMLHQAQRVICISAAEQGLIHQHFGQEISTQVIPVAAEVDGLGTAEPYEKPQERVVILTVGRLEFYKQTDRLVAALPALPAAYEVVIIGDGPARAHLEQLAVRLGVENRVRLLGHVPQRELLRWYRTADVYVTLSHQESFGMTLLEAAVAGSAVVASGIPAHREVAGYLSRDRIVFVPPDCQPGHVAQAVQEAVSLGRVTETAGWSLPTWADAVENSLSCYQKLLTKG